jgi:hypothetical protein
MQPQWAAGFISLGGAALGGIAVAIVLLTAACGYRTLAPLRKEEAPLRFELRMFDNQTPLVGFERMLGDALAEELLRRRAKVQYSGSPAPDFTLAGAVTEGEVLPYSFSSAGLALEYQVGVQIAVSLRAGGDIEPPWTHELLQLQEIYPGSSDAGVERSNRDQALRRIAKRVAGRIGDGLAQGL